MTSLWSTHVIEPGKTYDELDDTIKRPFDDTFSGEEELDDHIFGTLEKYFQHIAGHEDTRTFTPGESAYLLSDSLKQLRLIEIIKQENNGKISYYEDNEDIKMFRNRIADARNNKQKDLAKALQLEFNNTFLVKFTEKSKIIRVSEYLKLKAIVKDEEQYLKMQQNKTYQFVMLLASYTNEKIQKFFDDHSGKNVHTRVVGASGSGISVNRGTSGFAENVSKWYHNIEWADGLVHLAPMLYGHIEEAYTVIRQKWPHLKNAPLNAFTDSLDVRSMFARLVSMGIRTSDVLSGRRYHLQSTYSRVNMEKMRLLNYWHKVHYNGRDLVYDPQRKTVDQISTISQAHSYGGGNIFAYTNGVKDMNRRNLMPDRLKDVRNYL